MLQDLLEGVIKCDKLYYKILHCVLKGVLEGAISWIQHCYKMYYKDTKCIRGCVRGVC